MTLNKKKLTLVILGFLIFITGLFFIYWNKFFTQNSKLVPSEGGIYTEAVIGTVKNLNPLSENRSIFDRDLQNLIFAGLLSYDSGSGQITDGIAHLNISENARKYTLTLKDSVKFSDGENITIDDVRFTFEEIIQNPNFSNQFLFKAFEYITINIIDEKTIEFNLPERNVFFRYLLIVPILPKKYFENALIEEIVDPNYSFNKKPIGAGPFKIKNIIPNDDGSFRVFLEKNEYFYKGVPKINQLVFYVFPDFQFLEFAMPWPTMFGNIPSARIDSFQKKLFDNYGLREYLLPRWTGIFFNTKKEFVKNINFRKALSNSIDKGSLLEKEKGWKILDSFYFFEGIENWHETNFAKARSLLRDSGFPYDKEKKYRTIGKNGDKISLNFVTSISPPSYSRFAQQIARRWEEELDININVEILEEDAFQEALKEKNYDILFFGQNFSYNADSISMWHSMNSNEFNFSNFQDEEVDFLIEEIRFSGAQSDLFRLNEKLNALLPAIPITTPKYHLLISKKLFGFSENFGKLRSHADRFLGIENWYMFQKKAWDINDKKSKFFEFFKWIFN